MTSFVPLGSQQRVTRSRWAGMLWRISPFPAERPAPPKVEFFLFFYKAYMCHFARAHHLELLGVMISHKNMMFSAIQGFVTGALNKAVAPVSSSPEPNLTAYLTSFMDFVPAPTIHRHPSYIDPGAILPQLWVVLVLFPCILGSEHDHYHAQMGYKGRSEAYYKVRPSG